MTSPKPIYMHWIRMYGLKSMMYRTGVFPDYAFLLVTEMSYMRYTAQICNSSGITDVTKHPPFNLDPKKVKLIAFELTPAATVLQNDFNRFLGVEGHPISVAQRQS